MVSSHRLRAALLAGFALFGLIVLLYAATTHNHTDFIVYRAGARALLDGLPLYGDVNPGNLKLPFTYPPFSAAVLIPLTLVPATLAFAIYEGINVFALGAISYLTAKRLPELWGDRLSWRTWEITALIFGLATLSEPLTENFWFGQANVILVCLVLFDTVHRGRFTGALTGIAAGFKVTPGLFIVFMLAGRRWADAARAVAGFALTLVIGALFGLRQEIDYWTVHLFQTDRVGQVERVSNASINGILARLFPGNMATILWLIAAVAIVIGAMLLARAWWNTSRLVSACVVGLTTLLVSPVSWIHHWVWLIPSAAVCVALAVRAYRLGRRGVGAALAGATILTLIVTLTHARRYWDIFSSSADFSEYVIGTVYAACATAILGALWYALCLRDSLKSERAQPAVAVPGEKP